MSFGAFLGDLFDRAINLLSEPSGRTAQERYDRAVSNLLGHPDNGDDLGYVMAVYEFVRVDSVRDVVRDSQSRPLVLGDIRRRGFLRRGEEGYAVSPSMQGINLDAIEVLVNTRDSDLTVRDLAVLMMNEVLRQYEDSNLGINDPANCEVVAYFFELCVQRAYVLRPEAKPGPQNDGP